MSLSPIFGLDCFAQCDFKAIIDALRKRAGVHPARSAPTSPGARSRNGHSSRGGGARNVAASFVYLSAKGEPRTKVLRLQDERGKFFQQLHRRGIGKCCTGGSPTCTSAGDGWAWGRGGVRRILYRLDEIVRAPLTETILIVEGEGKADSLAGLGFTATSASEGAGKWPGNAYGECLEGRPVVILPDADGAGEAHASDIIRDLTDTASELRCIALPNLPAKGDIIDWLAGGGTREELLRLIDAAPVVRPRSEAFPKAVDTRVLDLTKAR